MQSKMLILKFPREASPEPVVCYLGRDYDLSFSILHASIFGVMGLELKGTRENFTNGLAYLKRKGIKVSRSHQEVRRNDTLCTRCGACTSVCPTAGPLLSHAPPWRCSSTWTDAVPANSMFPPVHPMP